MEYEESERVLPGHEDIYNQWPFMSQGDLLEELDRFGCTLTSQTLRRWQKASVICKPGRRSVGPGGKISSYSIMACAECYAAAILSKGGKQNGTKGIDFKLPRLSLPMIAFLRVRAFGRGPKLILPRRDQIERAAGRELPSVSSYGMNLHYEKEFDDIEERGYELYFRGCQDLWEKFFAEGMIKFLSSDKIHDAEPAKE